MSRDNITLGSVPRTPTLRVLAAQQDLACCFVYVKLGKQTNALFLSLCFCFEICCEFCLPILNLCVLLSSQVLSSSGVLMSVHSGSVCWLFEITRVGMCGPLSSDPHISGAYFILCLISVLASVI